MSAKLHIGMFTSSLPEPHRKPGGVDVLIDRVATQMTLRGHRVRLYTYSAKPPRAPYDHVRLRPHRLADSKLGRMTIAPLRLNALDTTGLDVLHLHGDDWFYVRRPLPTLRTFYGSALDEARTATRLRRRAGQAMTFALELVASRLATASYGLIPGRDGRYGVRGALACGVDVRPASPAEFADEPTILFVGTWAGRKRGELLARVFRDEVRPRHPTARLVLVSDDAEPAAGIEWVQRPTDEALAALFRQAWVFCLPSSYEGLGIPYLEAMGHGKPVVATPNPGAEYLLSGGAGVIADPAALGVTLNGLLSDSDRRSELAARALRRAGDFDWDVVCAQYEQAYRAVIEEYAA